MKTADAYAVDASVLVSVDASPDDALAPPQTDAAPFQCNDDSEIEPNGTIGDAFVTPIPDFGDHYALDGVAICPATDVDLLRVRVDQTGTDLTATIEFSELNGILAVEILSASGISLGSGIEQPGSPGTVTATLVNLPAGSYYVRVSAIAAQQNNYNIQIVTAPP